MSIDSSRYFCLQNHEIVTNIFNVLNDSQDSINNSSSHFTLSFSIIISYDCYHVWVFYIPRKINKKNYGAHCLTRRYVLFFIVNGTSQSTVDGSPWWTVVVMVCKHSGNETRKGSKEPGMMLDCDEGLIVPEVVVQGLAQCGKGVTNWRGTEGEETLLSLNCCDPPHCFASIRSAANQPSHSSSDIPLGTQLTLFREPCRLMCLSIWLLKGIKCRTAEWNRSLFLSWSLPFFHPDGSSDHI